jgi:hypothetical protein
MSREPKMDELPVDKPELTRKKFKKTFERRKKRKDRIKAFAPI